MHGSSLHGKDRFAAIFYKLVVNGLGIVVLAVGESGKRADTNHIAVAGHNGNGLQQMLALVTIHNDTTLGLQLPCSGIHVQYNHVHAQVQGSLLGREAGSQAIVEEHQQGRFVTSQLYIFITLFLYFLGLSQCQLQVT